MAPFALLMTVRDAAKTVMGEKTPAHMVGALTTKTVDLLQEQMAKIIAGVRTTV